MQFKEKDTLVCYRAQEYYKWQDFFIFMPERVYKYILLLESKFQMLCKPQAYEDILLHVITIFQ